MTAHRIAVVTAGLSQPSSSRVLADQLAAATRRHLTTAGSPGRGGRPGTGEPADWSGSGERADWPGHPGGEAEGDTVEVTVIELRELAHQLVDHLLTGFPAPALRQVLTEVSTADGLIAVTPVFTASYNALFKAFFDVLDRDALVGKPVLIAATGGTERHSLALEYAIRPLFGYLRAVVTPTAVYAAASDFGAASSSVRAAGQDAARQGGDTVGLATRIDRAAGEFATLLGALRPSAPRDPYADVVPFDQLLARTVPGAPQPRPATG